MARFRSPIKPPMRPSERLRPTTAADNYRCRERSNVICCAGPSRRLLACAVSQRRRDMALEMSYANEAPATRPITVVLADDHAVVRSGLRMLLDSDPQFEVVAEAGDVESARRYVRGHRPAVLVLDLNMPGQSSLE